jgi:hypothetical protein
MRICRRLAIWFLTVVVGGWYKPRSFWFRVGAVREYGFDLEGFFDKLVDGRDAQAAALLIRWRYVHLGKVLT